MLLVTIQAETSSSLRSSMNLSATLSQESGRKSGRLAMLESRAQQLMTTPGYVGTVIGISGIGKTYCANVISNLLMSEGVSRDRIFLHHGSELDDGLATIDWLDEIVSKDVRPKGLKAILTNNPISATFRVGKAALVDIAKKFGFEKTTEAVADIVGAQIPQTDRARGAGSRLGERVRALRTKFLKANEQYYVIVDAVEKISAPGVRILNELARMPIDNVRVILFIDDRNNAGREIRDLSDLRATLQSKHLPEIAQLGGLTPDEIQGWYWATNKRELPLVDAQYAYRNSSDGMPSILKPWIDCGSTDPNDVHQHGARAWGDLKTQVDQLSDRSRSVLQALACSYPSPLDVDTLLNLCHISPVQLASIRRELNSNALIIDTSTGLKCISKNLATFVAHDMGPSSSDYLSGLVLDATLGSVTSHRALPRDVMKNIAGSLLLADGNDSGAIEFVLTSVERSLVKGAYQLAAKLLSSIEALPNNKPHKWAPPNQVLHSRLRADLAGQCGDYQEAIRWARSGLNASRNEDELVALRIDLGEKLLRLGRYPEATLQFKAARKSAVRRQDANQHLRALLRSMIVPFDLGRFEPCIRLMAKLEEVLPHIQIRPENRCLCHRWIARTYAQSRGMHEQALNNINAALAIAEELAHERGIGNCHFVFGEIHRQQAAFGDALESYHKSLDSARLSGNKDLEVYSLLGKVLTFGAMGSRDQYQATLAELKSGLNYEAPVEAIYLRLLETLQDLRSNSGKESSELDVIVRDLTSYRKKALIRLLADMKQLSSGSWKNEMLLFHWESFVL